MYRAIELMPRRALALHDRIMFGGHFPDRVRCDTWSVDLIPLLLTWKRFFASEFGKQLPGGYVRVL
jgi:hypothetical protein